MLDLLAFAAFGREPADRSPVHDGADTPSAPHAGTEQGIDPQALAHASAAGLAPLLRLALHQASERLPPAQRDALVAAELTARARHHDLLDAAAELVDVCTALGVPVTLLKGIAVGERYFPAGHLRPMGDVDILVPGGARDAVESALRARGYLSGGGEWRHAPHGAPHWQPKLRVWVEVHDALFPAHEALGRTTFEPSRIAAHRMPWCFRGRPVGVLGDAFQLVYIASYWVRDLSSHAIHPSFAVPLLDAVALLRHAGDRLDWDAIEGWLDDGPAAASLYVMLSYLDRHDLAPSASAVLPRLARLQGRAGATELRLLHTLLDRWLLAGEAPAIGWRACFVWDALLSPGATPAKLLALPWRIVFPEAIADRYSAQHLLRLARRAARALRRNR